MCYLSLPAMHWNFGLKVILIGKYIHHDWIAFSLKTVHGLHIKFEFLLLASSQHILVGKPKYSAKLSPRRLYADRLS